MSRYKSDPEIADYEATKCCTSFLHYTWKTITCLFSHVTLVSMVVSYCVLGAFTFEALEVENEKQIKRGIYKIRENVTHHLWNFTQEMRALDQKNFTKGAMKYLMAFEHSLLDKMNKEGWDGEEDPDKVQWTRTGALFYSIIVITTIGYGHISPKTTWGKVVTIFYAILGIPLMLLCLSNIGDIMASSFRFLYWRVCCYMCQKKPKKMKRGKSLKGSSRFERGYSRSFKGQRYTGPPRAYLKRYGDLGGPISHSDTELRYLDEIPSRSLSFPRSRTSRYMKHDEKERKISRTSTISNHNPQNHIPPLRGYSLDRKKSVKETAIELDPMLLDNTPILFNKYVVGKDGGFTRTIPGKGITPRQTEIDKRFANLSTSRSCKSRPRSRNFLEPPGIPSSSDEEDLDSIKDDRTLSRPRKPTPSRRGRSRSPNTTVKSPSPRMMTPLGYGLRTRNVEEDTDDDYYYSDDPYDSGKPRIRPVPIWLCVFLVVSYILAGAYLFMTWEEWEYLDAAYFCFITLTTIGFGDLVPAKEVSRSDKATISIALCSLYLLFGISLLAMSFNLVQEEVIANVKSVAKKLGIIKSDSDDEEDD
ncbi:uncharacterized protein LOC130898746 isoform X1 [Diorhabda carinulata]|uniref:uncharacterized protein LOC130898746 isoform X1 n=1 Tax=Diorhabda carinulata TaxID=1163345 RepID=UPI0025A30B64|nr:uncharacterized protein LOC130898746 isoform X1 [Diorhabda carinulata]XP_057664216.1 uncharacterized protein LOC130898746 isoform X1 [Diorhabda carinulata]